MFSINYFKGFSVMRTSTLDETAMVCCNMAYKLVGGLNAGKFGYYSNQNGNLIPSADQDNNGEHAKEKDYCTVIKKVKKENITPENIGEIMLCQIPGISSASAIAILADIKTLPNLIDKIKENPNCLDKICTTDANGKSRKISKTAIASIIKYLLPLGKVMRSEKPNISSL
jgi:ERCC4-type nuclease